MDLIHKISEELQRGNYNDVSNLVQKALKIRVTPERILKEELIKDMELVGERFRKEELFIPEVLVAAKAKHTEMEVLRPVPNTHQ